MADKQKPCSLPTAKNGKHAWTFVKNAKRVSMGPTSGSVRAVGVYRCGCGRVREGRVNVNAPGASL